MTSVQEWQKHYLDMRKQRDWWKDLARAGGIIMIAQCVVIFVLGYKVIFP